MSVTQRLMQLGLYVEMDPDTFELNAWPADGHRRSRTGAAYGANVVRFQAPVAEALSSGNIKDDLTRVTRPYVKRTAVLAGGGEDIYGLATGPADIPWHGAWTIDPNTQAAAETAAEAQLSARSDASDNLSLRIRLGDTPLSGIYRPWDDIRLDDEVTVHTGGGAWEHNEATYPVAALRIQLTKGGAWDAWAELGSTFSSFLEAGFQTGAAPSTSTGPKLCLCTVPAAGGAIATQYEHADWQDGNADPVAHPVSGSPNLWGTDVRNDAPNDGFGTVAPAEWHVFAPNFTHSSEIVVTAGTVYRFFLRHARYSGTYRFIVNWQNAIGTILNSDVVVPTATYGTGWTDSTSSDFTAPTGAVKCYVTKDTGSPSFSSASCFISTFTMSVITAGPSFASRDEYTGTSSCAARCDHQHHYTDILDAPDFATDAELTSHAAAADPHTGYQKESEKGAANGYAGLGAGALVPIAQLASGTPDGTKYVRDDGTLATPAGGGGGRWEVMMVDGITPPEPMTTEDGTDWLYAWITD